MAASKSFLAKQKKMWNSWSRRKQLAYKKAYPRTNKIKRYGLKAK